MGEICFTLIRSLLRKPFVRKMMFFSGSAKWLPSLLKMAAFWPPALENSDFKQLIGSSLWAIFADDEVFPHWNTLTGFQCISMVFLLSLDDNFALQQFCWNTLLSSSGAPLYLVRDRDKEQVA